MICQRRVLKWLIMHTLCTLSVRITHSVRIILTDNVHNLCVINITKSRNPAAATFSSSLFVSFSLHCIVPPPSATFFSLFFFLLSFSSSPSFLPSLLLLLFFSFLLFLKISCFLLSVFTVPSCTSLGV